MKLKSYWTDLLDGTFNYKNLFRCVIVQFASSWKWVILDQVENLQRKGVLLNTKRPNNF